MKRSRFISSAVAAVMACNSMLLAPLSLSAATTVKVEAETGTLTNDAAVKTETAGFSGDGYVYLHDNASTIPSLELKVTLEQAGNFELRIGYLAPFGTKHATVEINGENKGDVVLEEGDTFGEVSFGKAAFKAGENTVKINGTWGYCYIDYITVGDYVAPERPEIKATNKVLCDPDATENAQKLFTYLNSVYGSHILSGQQEIYKYGPHDIETEFNYIQEKTGKLPAIRGFDYGNFCCPAFGSDDGSTERVIAWAEKGGIPTASFHLNVPTDFASYTIGSKIDWSATTYTEKTDFSPSKAATEGTKENQYYTQALDTLCTEFAKLQDKGITVLWRPLHEAEGNGGENSSWFWWGREGSKAYRQLWLYTYKYMTETKGLHNLIWEWNSYNFSTSANWYPGDDYVDIIGYDKYNCTDWSSGSAVLVHNTSPEANIFYGIMERYNSAKMVALMECDSFSTVGEIQEEKAGWLYFMPWYDGGSDSNNFLSNPMFNTEQDLIDMYTSDYCITLDELPKLTDIEVDPDATNPTSDNTEPTEPEAGHASISIDDKGNTVIDLPEAADTIYLVVETDADATYTNGGLGCTVPIDGKYYWANVMWVKDSSGDVEVKLADQLLNVTLNEDGENVEITDEAILAQVKEALGQTKSFQGQVWYTAAGDDELDKSTVTIKDAYVKSSQETTDATDPVETTEPTQDSSDTPSDILYGDVDDSGAVDIMDVITLNKSLLGGTTLSKTGSAAADVDLSGQVDTTDALNVLKAVVKLVTLPVKE